MQDKPWEIEAGDEGKRQSAGLQRDGAVPSVPEELSVLSSVEGSGDSKQQNQREQMALARPAAAVRPARVLWVRPMGQIMVEVKSAAAPGELFKDPRDVQTASTSMIDGPARILMRARSTCCCVNQRISR